MARTYPGVDRFERILFRQISQTPRQAIAHTFNSAPNWGATSAAAMTV